VSFITSKSAAKEFAISSPLASNGVDIEGGLFIY
jgi:hypothetical protein